MSITSGHPPILITVGTRACLALARPALSWSCPRRLRCCCCCCCCCGGAAAAACAAPLSRLRRGLRLCAFCALCALCVAPLRRPFATDALSHGCACCSPRWVHRSSLSSCEIYCVGWMRQLRLVILVLLFRSVKRFRNAGVFDLLPRSVDVYFNLIVIRAAKWRIFNWKF